MEFYFVKFKNQNFFKAKLDETIIKNEKEKTSFTNRSSN
jgi:hypothetical protein